MKKLRPLIESRRAAYEAHPYITNLQNSELPAAERMAYAAYSAHWILTFGDINRFILNEVNAEDPVRDMIIEHTNEDSKHWEWYLRDLVSLDQNPSCQFTDALRFLWGADSAHTRLLSYKIIAWGLHACAEMKIALIETMESMGNVWLRNTVIPAREISDKLIYFGDHHLDRETGHVIGAEQDEVEAVVIPEPLRAEAVRMVHDIFDATEAMNSEVLERVRRQRGRFTIGA